MEPNPAPEASNNIDSFINEVAQPTIPAMTPGSNGGAPLPPPPGYSPSTAPPPHDPRMYTPPSNASTIFTDGDAHGDTDSPGMGDDMPAKKPASPAYTEKVLRGIINAEDQITATITALVAGQEDNTPFRSSDQDKDDLVTLMEPFQEWIIDKCPATLPFFMVYATVKTKQFAAGRKAFKANKANKEGANDANTVRRVANSKSKRTNFVIYTDGYYRNRANGSYIRRDSSQQHLLERPDIRDLDEILNVNSNRDRQILTAAFGWGEDEFRQHNIQ